MPLNSRAKGQRGERELSGIWNDHGFETKRGLQARDGTEVCDVVGVPGLWMESKWQERLEIEKWCRRTEADAPSDYIPVVCWRRSWQPWRVSLPLEDFIVMYKASR